MRGNLCLLLTNRSRSCTVPKWQSRNVIIRTLARLLSGEFVVHELVDVSTPTCPMELEMIPVEKCDPHLDLQCKGNESMPYMRSDYDRATGQQPNMARVPVS